MLALHLEAPLGLGALPLFEPEVEAWRPKVAERATDFPTDFLLAWIHTESRGVFDAVPPECKAVKPISQCEHGLFQVSPVEASDYLKLTAEEFARILTSPDWSLETGLRLARYYRDKWAAPLLARVGVKWSTRDFYKLVRLQHGGIGIAKNLMNACLARGFTPTSWAQYTSVLDDLNPEIQDYAARTIANAAFAGNYVPNNWRPAKRNVALWILGGSVAAAVVTTGIYYAVRWRSA